MNRRTFFPLLFALRSAYAYAQPAIVRLRGRLIQEGPQSPGIAITSGERIVLEGDKATVNLLKDERLKDADFEVEGQTSAPGRFRVRPIHERGAFLYRNDKRLVVTYWCEKCAIRTYSPGYCVCCQEYTELDPRDPALKDDDPTRSQL